MSTLSLLWVACRFVHFLAVMQLFGISVFTRLLAPAAFGAVLLQRLRYWQGYAALVALLTACLMVAVQGGLMGEGWPDVTAFPIWLAVLNTAFGQVWRWHLLFAALLLLSVLLPADRWRDRLILLLTFALLVGLGSVGHAAMREGMAGLAQRANHTLHLLSAAYWFGSLLPLLRCLRFSRGGPWRQEAILALLRFSTFGHLAVALVIATGAVDTWLIVQGWPFESRSPYQMLLLVKAALVAVMVAVALYNRYRIVPRFTASPVQAQRGVVRATSLLLGLSVLVLLLVSLFATLEPVAVN
ncbi:MULTISPECIES: copper homeostasis membrane protein CopD [Yersiniaceae]|uniref:Copper resistance protein D n=1 Tax=Nissabacter archeti TaxID=1917880 RepID=A0ABS5JJK9_9GAMM|nr:MULTISPECIES: copper homeostasis membrane protein CopD [Yersiniaceae]MBS0969979.1 copper homeostasis membrane protein CopD [Nissabacter archeti]PLR40022.1 copper resistance protein CopD [Chimaeribacter arupi]